MTKKKNAIHPTREENYAEWYQEVLKAADLAEHSAVRGCMVIKPWGYGIWENLQRNLDQRFKETGHQNAYFPLFIPLSFFEKEAEHVEGFAKECAVVTHHRLEKGEKGGLVPAGKLEEPLIVRPTSEMIIGHHFAKWIESHRDLPILINQWCNVVRWEMRTRMFLRTTEFLWQEGHTAHATREEAENEARQMLAVYAAFGREVLAIPFVTGEKTESERFPGAIHTYTIEAMMQDRKAIQGGTSHFLGQNFAKACNIVFQNEAGERELAWTTSWGTTTRLVGGLIMTHSDDDGLVLPPRVAPSHVVILPILHADEGREEILSYAEKLRVALSKCSYHGEAIRVLIDKRDLRGGEKNWQWIKKGIPLRIEIGKREVEADSFSVARRDRPHTEKKSFRFEELIEKGPSLLEEIQRGLLEKAEKFRDSHTKEINTREEFDAFFHHKEEETGGGFALCHWNRDPKWEAHVKETYNVTIRCMPFGLGTDQGKCLFTQEPSPQRVLFARAY